MRIKQLTLFLSILLIILSGCSKKETVFRIPFTSMPETYDKLIRAEFFTNIVNDNIFEELVKSEADRAETSLAEYWYNPNDSLYVVKLRENSRFSNGKKFTAKDAKASIERALTHPSSFIKELVKVDSIIIKNEYMLYIYHPNSPFIVSLFNIAPMYSEDILSRFDDRYLAENPLGTGKYFLFSSSPDLIVLKKNKYHPKYKQNKKSPDTIEIYYEPSITNQYNMLKNNQVDFMFNIPAEKYPELINNKRFQIIEKLSNVVMYMMFDVNSENSPEISLYSHSEISNPLSDKRVRLAMAHAIDTQAFIDKQLNSKALRLSLPLLCNLRGYQTDLPYINKDIAKAKQLLHEAGFAEGFAIRLRSIQKKFSGDYELAIFIKNSLKEINIDVEIDFYHSDEFYKSLDDKPASVFLTGYTTKARSITSSVRSLYFSENNTRSPQNRMNYHISEVNNLYKETLKISDYDFRHNELLREISLILYDKFYILPFYQPFDLIGLNNKFAWNYRNENFSFSDFRVK